MGLAYSFDQFLSVAVTLLIAFTIHEYAHAIVAYKFGDHTAARQGRLTLNPLKHLDPVGTILIFLVGFGWAKPVPVNRFFFKNPRLAGVFVSAAGPVSNLILVMLTYLIWYGVLAAGLGSSLTPAVIEFVNIFIGLNLMLFVFNLLPIPPLDGYRIVEDLAPADVRAKLTQFEKYGMLIFLVLVITPLYQYTIAPIFHTVIPFLSSMLNAFFLQLFQ